MKGNSYGSLSKEMEEINQDLGIQIITEKYHSSCSKNTSQKIHDLNINFPKVLKLLFNVDKDRI